MDKLQLRIVMPGQRPFEGETDQITVRTACGDVSILPRHMDYAAVLGSGEGRIMIGGEVRRARISGGMLHVSQNRVHILTNEFEWVK